MREFEKLVDVLERELECQEELLKLLASERVAIVHLNSDELNAIRRVKERIYDNATTAGQTREHLLEQLGLKSTKFMELVEKCPNTTTRDALSRVGRNLKQVADRVREMNDHNSEMIRQSLGMIASTVAIFRGFHRPESETYTQSGQIGNQSNSKRNSSCRKSGQSLSKEV